MEMITPKIWDDPYYQEAVKLFDMWDWGWGMPSDPHARENLRHATGLLAAGTTHDPEQFLEFIARRYLGNKYQDTVLSEARRIARNARYAVDKRKEENNEQSVG